MATPTQKAAWLWFYDKHFKVLDMKNGTPFDTPSYYPHHSILSFVNWPLDIKPRDPAECIPRVSTGKTFGYCMFRNRPQAGARAGKKKPAMPDVGADDDDAGALGPEPVLAGEKIKVGNQTIAIKDGVIVLGKIAPEWQK